MTIRSLATASTHAAPAVRKATVLPKVTQGCAVISGKYWKRLVYLKPEGFIPLLDFRQVLLLRERAAVRSGAIPRGGDS